MNRNWDELVLGFQIGNMGVSPKHEKWRWGRNTDEIGDNKGGMKFYRCHLSIHHPI